MDIEKAKALATAEVEARRQELIDLSLKIHSNPELGFQEVKAAALLTDYLEAQGFSVERGICELPTAFRATYGEGRPRVAFLAEYDALPKLGHACGHNIIATSAMGAAVAAKAASQGKGTILVIGTPAEEIHGGKAFMVKRGGFEGLDAAMMIHPYMRDIAVIGSLALAGLDVEFFGKAAHAAARPEEGVNALEALIISFNGINSLRQHVRSGARIHGIITDGGEAPNIVPAHAAASFLIRAEDDEYLDELCPRVLDCFKAGALATGARLEHRWAEVRYDVFRANPTLAQLFSRNMETLGRKVQEPRVRSMLGSVDMGNVSRVVPSIHGMVTIAPKEVVSHSPEFREAAVSQAGHEGLIIGAKALAMTALDLILDPEAMARATEEFSAQR